MKNDVKNRKKKKKNGTKILVLLWILVFVLIGFELVFKNDVKFIALDYLSRASTNEIGNVKSKELTEVKVVSLDEFLGYGNVNVDESLLLVNDKHR